ncbi:uncharacterized protein CEXT_102821 [Caerostris extrusa]|uniref:Uncharacterized protein n=1 Tax=Caerostris extrusa TaxID=172846 RepID=A0AAV4QER2_CAEEX|nr:uncharacterized protein CEXT_102821 [Caerostris extrusa]
MFLDMVLPFLPCVLWLMMYNRKSSLKAFLTHLAKTVSANFFILHSRHLQYSINSSLCLILIYPPLLIVMKNVRGNDAHWTEIFRNLQEIVVPCIVAIAYTSVCYLLLSSIKSFKELFREKIDLFCPHTTKLLMKNYFDIVKGSRNI